MAKKRLAYHQDRLSQRNQRRRISMSGYHRPVRKATNRFDWNMLPLDVLDIIQTKLSLAELHRLRLSGVGSTSPTVFNYLHHSMLKRVSVLHGIWTAMSENDLVDNFQKYLPNACSDSFLCRQLRRLQLGSRIKYRPSENDVRSTREWPPRPTEVGEMTGELRVCTITPKLCNAIAEEMTGVSVLCVCRRDLEDEKDNTPKLTDLPSEIGRCSNIKTLSVREQDFYKIPDAVLEMENLEELHISDSVRLKSLPADIGVQLPCLRFIALDACGISSLPTSLFDTIEYNITNSRSPLLFGMAYDSDIFPKEYWKEALSESRYPHLSKAYILREHMIPWIHDGKYRRDSLVSPQLTPIVQRTRLEQEFNHLPI